MKRHGTGTRTSREARRASAWWAPRVALSVALACVASCGQAVEADDAPGWSTGVPAPYPRPCETWLQEEDAAPTQIQGATFDARWRLTRHWYRLENTQSARSSSNWIYNTADEVIRNERDSNGDGAFETVMICDEEDAAGRCVHESGKDHGRDYVAERRFDAEGRLVMERRRARAEETWHTTRRYVFDADLLVEDVLEQGDARTRLVNAYTPDGSISSWERWFRSSPDEAESLTRKVVHAYGEAGELLKTTTTTPAPSSEVTYTYDEELRETSSETRREGELVYVVTTAHDDDAHTRTTRTGQGDTFSRTVHTFDGEGDLVLLEVDHEDDGVVDRYYTFGVGGRIDRAETRTPGRESTMENTYTERGNISRRVSVAGSVTSTQTFLYDCFTGEDPR